MAAPRPETAMTQGEPVQFAANLLGCSYSNGTKHTGGPTVRA